ncbi:MAG TPA: DUF1707 domain-containing protein [Acidimicrobiales bacterium]|nr:DUF1707 domain-containing protein [Acidimicrobiales bacterium]
MSGGLLAYVDHPFHHYWAAGPSLFGLVLPVLLLVSLAASRSRGRNASALPYRPKPSPGPSRAVTGRAGAVPPVLASDDEREETARLVSHAVGEGRLSIEEGGQRIDAVLRARHRHELEGLVADLPLRSQSTTIKRSATAPIRPALLVVGAAVVLAAVLLQASAGLWELWPIAVVVLGASALLPRR